MRILVVDDEMVSRTKLKLIMEHFGQCDVADNGKTALALFGNAHRQDRPFDLVMLDINMPEMDGIQVLSEMIQTQIKLKTPSNRKAKILMVTSYTDKDRVLSCIQSGCDDYIAKPFDIDTIGKKLSKLGIRVRKNEPGQKGARSNDANSSSHFIDGIVSAFEGKKINLPTLPRIQPKFRELLMTGAVSQRIADLLKKGCGHIRRIDPNVKFRLLQGLDPKQIAGAGHLADRRCCYRTGSCRTNRSSIFYNET